MNLRHVEYLRNQLSKLKSSLQFAELAYDGARWHDFVEELDKTSEVIGWVTTAFREAITVEPAIQTAEPIVRSIVAAQNAAYPRAEKPKPKPKGERKKRKVNERPKITFSEIDPLSPDFEIDPADIPELNRDSATSRYYL